MQTNNISVARVVVGNAEDAQFIMTNFHRQKIGYKRIFISVGDPGNNTNDTFFDDSSLPLYSKSTFDNNKNRYYDYGARSMPENNYWDNTSGINDIDKCILESGYRKNSSVYVNNSQNVADLPSSHGGYAINPNPNTNHLPTNKMAVSLCDPLQAIPSSNHPPVNNIKSFGTFHI